MESEQSVALGMGLVLDGGHSLDGRTGTRSALSRRPGEKACGPTAPMPKPTTLQEHTANNTTAKHALTPRRLAPETIRLADNTLLSKAAREEDVLAGVLPLMGAEARTAARTQAVSTQKAFFTCSRARLLWRASS